MYRYLVPAFLLGVSFLLAPRPVSAVTIATVPVGNPGNAMDQNYSGQGQFGAVPYGYRIGAYEVTNEQYAEFLNAKAVTDPLGLYNASMGSNARGGISRTGVSGSFTYAARADMANKPVNFISWDDAIRFTNWLHNGQAAGDTETGAYTKIAGLFTRTAEAKWFMPTENEWYKAAYYDPRSEADGGPTGDDNYWRYAYQSDLTPLSAAAIDALGPTRGDIANPGARRTNFASAADWNGQNGNVTTVGSAGPLTASYYGTFDQGGNIWEWTESRFLRGGHYSVPTGVETSASYRNPYTNFEIAEIGFRVAAVPEPGAFLLAACAGVGLALAARRSRGRRPRPH